MSTQKLLDFIGYAKKFCVALIAALGVTAAALADGHVNALEGVQIALAFLGALGVYHATNSSSSLDK